MGLGFIGVFGLTVVVLTQRKIARLLMGLLVFPIFIISGYYGALARWWANSKESLERYQFLAVVAMLIGIALCGVLALTYREQ